MEKAQPRVSVIIASYNTERFIAQSIESILAQTMTDLELIVIDDCSDDGSLAIAKRYEKRDIRVRVFQTDQNSGPGPAWNLGIDAARSEWLAILDSDDLAKPDRLGMQLQVAAGDPRLVLVGTGCIFQDADGHRISKYRYPTRHAQLLRHLTRLQAFPPHSSMLYRAETVKHLGGFNPRFSQAQDKDLCLRLAERGEFTSLTEPLVTITKHSQNLGGTAGRTGLVLGLAARVCYFLRELDKPDPSSVAATSEWVRFVEWIRLHADQESVFTSRDLAVSFRRATPQTLRGKVRWISRTLRTDRPAFVAAAMRRTYGTSLPKKLAEQWDPS